MSVLVGRVHRMDYADVIAQESARTADALAQAPLTAPVPSCADWDAADLAYHLGEVQDFWSQIVGQRPGGSRRRRATRSAGPTTSSSRSCARARDALLGRARRARPGRAVLVLVVRRAARSSGCCAGRRTRRWCTGSTPSRPPGCRSPTRGSRSRPTGSTRCSGSWSAGCRSGPRSRPTGSASGCSPPTPAGSGSWRSAGSTGRRRPRGTEYDEECAELVGGAPWEGEDEDVTRDGRRARRGTSSCGSGGVAARTRLARDGRPGGDRPAARGDRGVDAVDAVRCLRGGTRRSRIPRMGNNAIEIAGLRVVRGGIAGHRVARPDGARSARWSGSSARAAAARRRSCARSSARRSSPAAR